MIDAQSYDGATLSLYTLLPPMVSDPWISSPFQQKARPFVKFWITRLHGLMMNSVE